MVAAVAGHTGMAGSAIVRRLRQESCTVLVADRHELDLTRQDQTERYLSAARPGVVIMAAGRVGGAYTDFLTHAPRER
jgi:GDP-L-fucose synthase